MEKKGKELTLTGDIDPVFVVTVLRKHWKHCYSAIFSVGPAKYPRRKGRA